MTVQNVSRSPQQAVLEETGPVRFGLIALATDLTSEGDFGRIFPDGTALHTTRVAFENPTTPENLKKMAPRLKEAAANLVPGMPLKAICYSCTAASATIGDDVVSAAINTHQPGVPVVTPTGAALKAFSALGVSKIAVLTPYLPETSQPVADYFSERGLDVQRLHCFGLEDDRDMARVSARSIIDGALEVDGADNEAIFISCTALPAVGVIAEIERLTGKPVVTSNQASAWAMLRLGGFDTYRPSDWGRLFTLDYPAGDRENAA